MERYDPEMPPDPAAWLALDEDERVLLVKEFHRRSRERAPNAVLHASMHVVVENQIARGEPPPVTQTLERLIGAGSIVTTPSMRWPLSSPSTCTRS